MPYTMDCGLFDNSLEKEGVPICNLRQVEAEVSGGMFGNVLIQRAHRNRLVL